MARTAKTELVMNLLSGSAEKKNPHLRGERPASREVIAKLPAPKANPSLRLSEESGAYSWNYRGKQLINIISMLINEELGEIVDRFNICACDDCLRYITETVLCELPAVFVRVGQKADEKRVNELLSEYRPAVIKALTHTAILMRTRRPHERKA